MSSTKTTGGRPSPLEVVPENIPEMLKELPNWVLWKYVAKVEADTGEVDWDKPPFKVGGNGNASSTDPKTWSTWVAAFEAYTRGGWDGLGFVLAKDKDDLTPGIVGVDLDDCRNVETGEIEPWAIEYIRLLDTYTEVSPSGRGVRMFIVGVLPPGRRKGKKFEIYSTARYVTCTGVRVDDTPSTIEQRQQQIDIIHIKVFGERKPESEGNVTVPTATVADIEVIERMKKDRRVGKEINELWQGGFAGHATHSEADASLCNHIAYYVGPDKGRIDDIFSQSGLFRTKWQREDYRDKTINLAIEGRVQFFVWKKPKEKTEQRAAATPAPHQSSNGTAPPIVQENGQPEPFIFSNFYPDTVLDPATNKEKEIKVGRSSPFIRSELLKVTPGWPRRVGPMLFVEDGEGAPLWIESPACLFGWIASNLSDQEPNSIKWTSGSSMVSEAQFHAYLCQASENFDAIEAYPHYPELPRTYYMHHEVEGGNGKALKELLARFKPASLVDGDLLLAFFLSILWGGQPGQRPAWLFTTDDADANQGTGRGIGKSTVPRLGSRLVGGAMSISTEEKMEAIKTRLLSAEGMRCRLALLDNIKTLRLSLSDLEALITSDVISGRQLYVGEGRRPNNITWALTLNGANLSTDLAQRCVPLKLARPDYSATWEDETVHLIESKRWAIIGDAVAILKGTPATLARHSRWASWERSVLAHVGDPSECQRVIEERQGEIDDDVAEADLVEAGFAAQLVKNNHDPDTAVVFFSSKQAAEILNETLGEKYPVNRANVFLGILKISSIRKSNLAAERGWTWIGANSPIGKSSSRLSSLFF